MLSSCCTSFSCNSIPRSGCSVLHGMNPNPKKMKIFHSRLLPLKLFKKNNSFSSFCLQKVYCFLKANKFSQDGHFVYLFLSLDLFIIAILNSFGIKSVSFPEIFLLFIGASLYNNILTIFVKTPYWLSLYTNSSFTR